MVRGQEKIGWGSSGGARCYPESFRGYTDWPACTKCGSRVLHKVLQSATQGATHHSTLPSFHSSHLHPTPPIRGNLFYAPESYPTVTLLPFCLSPIYPKPAKSH